MIVDSYETQATIGYKYSTINYKYGSPDSESGKISWEAMPIEIIQFYRPGNIRVGLGLAYQLRPRLTVDVPNANYANYYDNAYETIVQFGWAPIGKPYTIEARYSSATYKQNDVANSQEANGNVLGIYTNYYF